MGWERISDGSSSWGKGGMNGWSDGSRLTEGGSGIRRRGVGSRWSNNGVTVGVMGGLSVRSRFHREKVRTVW